MSEAGGGKVLIVGGTGHLGGSVVREALAREKRVRALVRPGSDLGALTARDVEIVRGDLLDPDSLRRAMSGCAAVITTAIGYANRRKGDARKGIDTVGNRNLVDAARQAGIGRFVLCSILTCERARSVPHFWDKKLTEDYLEQQRVPFIALRPGAFLDQGPGDFWAAGLRKGRLAFLADPHVPLTFVHTHDVARCLVGALDIDTSDKALRIDIGCDRAVSVADLAGVMSRILGRPIDIRVPPWPLVSIGLRLAGLFDRRKSDLKAMMSYIQKGFYIADITRQRTYFGEIPSVEEAVRRYLADIGMMEAAIPPRSAMAGQPRSAA